MAHVVYFTLKDGSDEAQDSLVAACREYLNDHPGLVHFSVGRRAKAYQRDVNDTRHEVGIVLVFATEADHERYQTSDRHEKFISEQSSNWAEVRVFDTLV
ncbi:MAG: Dabb family protein [Planctomycetes bacterium]|nr:Dabb family protein [Planctomycetota bacterium]